MHSHPAIVFLKREKKAKKTGRWGADRKKERDKTKNRKCRERERRKRTAEPSPSP